ncbi:hypothetical protein BGW37DRAFT_484578 [Umbelopsis sp. PMI_123]|nr:hypothetical protein BGW37DRAFT_484578 [Umbelopsis sp. PMI_123]
MPIVKTADFEQLLDALRYRLNNCRKIVEPFDRHVRYRRLAFSSFINRKRGIHEVCRSLTFGSRKYGRQCTPLDYPIEDDLQQYIIAFGKTSFGNMRGKKSSPVKKIFQHLCYLSRVKCNISVIKMDEYLTSQICANYDQRTLKNVKERRNFDGTSCQKIHALLSCETCSKGWNRNQMASKNIKYIFEHMDAHDNERLQQFRRPRGAPPNVEE